jgi:hypothetical protein
MILISLHHKNIDCIGGVMVSVLAWNAVDRGFEPRSGQTKADAVYIFMMQTD